MDRTAWIMIGGFAVVLIPASIIMADRDDRAQAVAVAASSAAAQAALLPPEAVAQCRKMIATATEGTIIVRRPAPAQIDVNEAAWAQMDYPIKDALAQAIACDVWGTAMPPEGSFVIVTGAKSGKTLAMLTAQGMDRR